MFKALIVQTPELKTFFLVYNNINQAYANYHSRWMYEKWYERISFDDFACFEYKENIEILPVEPFNFLDIHSCKILALAEFIVDSVSFAEVSLVKVSPGSKLVELCLSGGPIGIERIPHKEIYNFFGNKDVCGYDKNSFFNADISFQDNLKRVQVKDGLTFIGGNEQIVIPFFKILTSWNNF